MNNATPISALRITGGRVVDPAHGPAWVRDVLIAEGKIVDQLPPGPCQSLDATGRLVLPGAIDMHTHVASRGVALARQALGQAAAIVPTPRDTGRAYLRQGYTTVIDAAVPPEDVDVARATFDAMPQLTTGFLLELGTHRPLLDALDRNGDAAAVELIGELLAASGALGLKLVNPGHADALDAPIVGTRITPRRLTRVAAAAVERFNLAHPLHIHGLRLGEPGNVEATLALLDALSDHRVHLAHAQFHAYGHDAGRLVSGAAQLADYLDAHLRITADTGCIQFGSAVMITRDQPLAERLHAFTDQPPVIRHGWCVAPLHYSPQNPVNAIQWAIGLELILRSADLSRLALSIDHPNGGPFTALPALLSLLMHHGPRDAALADIHPAARQHTGLAQLDRELSNDEAVRLTRLAPAQALGLAAKGHLGVGADADVVVTRCVEARPEVVIQAGRIAVGSAAAWR